MIWTNARNRGEKLSLGIVWILRKLPYHRWDVMSQDGRPHQVLGDYLVAPDEMRTWLESMTRDCPQPPRLAEYLANEARLADVPTDQEVLTNIPQELKDQLSDRFKKKYGL